MKITTVSQKLLNFLNEFESFESKPYLCPAGIPTIGFGTTFYFDTKKNVTLKDKPITEEEALRLKLGHINRVFAPLVDKLTRDDLTQNEFDALVSFTYNAGATYRNKKGQLLFYNIYKNVNNCMTGNELINYWSNLAITGGGKKLNGLIKRRKREVDMFLNGNY